MKDRLKPQIRVLSNGITIYHIPSDVPYVTARFVVPFGSGHNTGDIVPGTFHFLEHVVLLRSKLYPGYREWGTKVGLVGGYSNAATSRSCTSYEVSVPVAHEYLLDGLFSAVHYPVISAEDVIGERGVIRNERKMKERWYPGDDEIEHYMFTEWLLEDADYITQRLGSDENLENITAEYLQGIHEQYYRTGKAFLIISGSFDMDRIVSVLEQVQTTHAAPYFQERAFSWADPQYREVAFTDASRFTYHLGALAQKDIKSDIRCRFGLGMLANSTHGPLFRWLRDEKKWVYGVNVQADSTYENMSFGISLPFSEYGHVAPARAELLDRIKAAFSDEALIAAEKERYLGQQTFQFSTPGEVIGFLLGKYRTYGRFIYETELDAIIQGITSADLLSMLDTAFGELLVMPKN